jgi:hypothetical protein
MQDVWLDYLTPDKIHQIHVSYQDSKPDRWHMSTYIFLGELKIWGSSFRV